MERTFEPMISSMSGGAVPPVYSYATEFVIALWLMFPMLSSSRPCVHWTLLEDIEISLPSYAVPFVIEIYDMP